MNQKTNRSGFTLIELLVVIAIIAILAAILFPVFIRAKKNAKNTSCVQQMKQYGLAFIRYTDDHGGGLPHSYSPIWPGGQNEYCWMEAIAPYIQSKNKRPGATFFGCPSALPSEKASNTTYAMSWYHCANNGGKGANLYNNLTQMARDKKSWFIADAKPYFVGTDYLKWYPPQLYLAFRHNKRANFVFSDGHVKGYTWREAQTRCDAMH